MSNLPPPGPPGPTDPDEPPEERPYGSLHEPGAEPTQAAGPGYGTTPPAVPYQPYAAGPQQPYGQSPYAAPAGVESHGGATTSMVLGIVGIVATVAGWCLCLILGAAGAFIGPFAIWQARKAQQEMRAAPGRYRNAGEATAGLVCGIVATVLGAVTLVLGIVVMVVYGAAILGVMNA